MAREQVVQPDHVGRQYLLAFVLSFLAVFAFCRLTDLNMLVLRAESSTVLATAFAPTGEQIRFFKRMLRESYTGHYIPLGFALETLIARMTVTSAAWSMVVQCAFVSGTAVAMGGILRSLSGSWLAFPAVLCFVFTPTFIDLTAWPFMKLQFICMALGAAALIAALRYGATLQRSDAVLAMALGYGSMHAFGVGLPVSLATIVVICVLARRGARLAHVALPVAAFLALTCLHGWLMVRGGTAVQDRWMDAGTLALRFGALIMRSVIAGPLSIYAPQIGPYTGAPLLADALYGYGLLAAVVFITLRSLRKDDGLRQFTVQAFALLAWLICLAAMIWRLKAEPNDAALGPYIFGGRYTVFTAYFALIWLMPYLAIRWRLQGMAAFSLLCAIGTAGFLYASAPAVWPHLSVSQEAYWEAYLAECRERLSQGLPLVNRTIAPSEFGYSARNYEGLLKHQLRQKEIRWSE